MIAAAFQWEQFLRVEDIKTTSYSQLKNNTNDFEWFSLSLTEWTDAIDTALFLFEESVLSLKWLKNTSQCIVRVGITRGKNIFKEFEKNTISVQPKVESGRMC